MKKFKRLTALALALVMVLGLTTGRKIQLVVRALL